MSVPAPRAALKRTWPHFAFVPGAVVSVAKPENKRRRVKRGMTARDVESVRTRLTVGGKNCFRHVRKSFYLIVRIRKPPDYLESGGRRRRSSHTGEFLEGKGSQWLG